MLTGMTEDIDTTIQVYSGLRLDSEYDRWQRMDAWFQAEASLAAGGALIGAMLGAGWPGWGLGNAKALNGFVAPTFGFTALFLFGFSIYFLLEGRLLRNIAVQLAG